MGLFRSDLFGSLFLRLGYYLFLSLELKNEFLRAFDHIHNANLPVISNKIIKLLFFLTCDEWKRNG